MSGAGSLLSYTQRINARMTRDEALKAMVRMLTAYSTFRCSDETMLTLAEVLMSFPREVATAACSPIHGVPKTCKEFPPNAGQITDWCTREATGIYSRAKWERDRQLLPPPLRARAPDPTRSAPAGHGRLANLFVGVDKPGYDRMVERSKQPGTSPDDWCWYEGSPKWGAGIKVRRDWYNAKPIVNVKEHAQEVLDRAPVTPWPAPSESLWATLKEQESKYGPIFSPAGGSAGDSGDGC
jgi:hypothetical protein